MLDFLKKIFQNGEQETKKAIEIRLPILEEWLKEKSRPLMEDARIRIEEFLMKLNEELQRTRFNVEVLENAKLQNPNIPFKAKQYMEGNRKSYARYVNSFLGRMEINNKDYFYLKEFCRQFDELLDELNKSTLRSYTILQEFFANEAGKIAANIKNFDRLFFELKSALNDKSIVAANSLIEKAKALEARGKQKVSIELDLRDAEASAKLALNSKDSVLAEIEEFNKSERHSSFLKLNEEKRAKERAFAEDENKILQAFSILERPLRKYSHIAFEHEEIVLEYLKDPIETLVNDKSLKILEVLDNLRRLLSEDGIELDGRKKEKSMEELRKMDKEFIDGFLKKNCSHKSEIGELDRRIKATEVAEKLKEFNKKIDEANLTIEKTNDELGRLKDDFAKIDRKS